MSGNEKTVYGWITKQNPFVVVIGYDEKKISGCKEQAEAQAGRKVMFFKYHGVCVSCPGESSSNYTQEHGNQISKFVQLMLATGRDFPDCVFNDENVNVVKNVL